MIVTIARRNLLHDRIRFAVTVVGIVFAVVLLAVQLGLFVGFSRTTSNLIDHTAADLWVSSVGVKDVDQATVLDERRYLQALALADVAWAEKLIVRFALLKKPQGGSTTVIVVGFDLASGRGGPWNIVEGDVADLARDRTVAIDRSYAAKLGVSRLWDVVEINGLRARVAVFTDGIKSFTQSPYVFTAFKNALDYSRIKASQANYVLIGARPGSDTRALAAQLAEALPDVEVWTREGFARQTQNYWMFTTGAGTAILSSAALGLIVGAVVVAQTLYASTVDHLPEFGTLKAMGAPNSYIYKIIVVQAVTSGVLGYAVGLVLAIGVAWASTKGGPTIIVTPGIAGLVFLLTQLMCLSAALVSISKVTTVDPAVVFKG